LEISDLLDRELEPVYVEFEKNSLEYTSVKKYSRSRVIIGIFARIKEVADQCRRCPFA